RVRVNIRTLAKSGDFFPTTPSLSVDLQIGDLGGKASLGQLGSPRQGQADDLLLIDLHAGLRQLLAGNFKDKARPDAHRLAQTRHSPSRSGLGLFHLELSEPEIDLGPL